MKTSFAFLSALVLIVGCAQAEPTRNGRMSNASADAAPAAPAGEPPSAASEKQGEIELLRRAEAAADEVDTLRARLRYDRVQGLLGDQQRRFGALLYDAGGEKRAPRFAVRLTRLLVDGKPREIDKRYVYDGRWLAEIDGEDKTFIRRELVPEGERGRLLEMGEGPFALPLNMKVEAVRQRFRVEDVTAEAENDQPTLTLTPREGYDVGLDQITIAYDAETMLPTTATTVEDAAAGELSVLRLFDTQTGVEIADDLFDTTPPEGDGWDVQVVEIAEGDE